MRWQHVLQQQAVQILPGLDLILLCAVLVLQQEVLAEAGLILGQRNIVRSMIYIINMTP